MITEDLIIEDDYSLFESGKIELYLWCRKMEAKIGLPLDQYYRIRSKQLEETIETQQKLIKAKEKEIEDLRKQYLDYEIKNLVPESVGDFGLFIKKFSEVDSKDLMKIMGQLKSRYPRGKFVFILFAIKEDRIFLCLGFSTELVSGYGFDASALVPQLTELIGGKGGGGRPELASGSGTNPNGTEDVILKLREFLVNYKKPQLCKN